MRLTEFIQKHQDKIIKEWVAFASSLLPWAKGLDEKELRDHAAELLVAVVADMKTAQSDHEQAAKSRGHGAAAEGSALAKVGHKHASQRLDTGFNLDQLVSEYRALRATILRQWAKEQGDKQGEMTRFNEAIDESMSEATIKYSEILDHTREQFVAILGHDLRNPLSAITMGVQLLADAENLDDRQARVAARVVRSAGRMDRMVADLLDLTRTRLGSGIPITRKRMDLAPVCQHVIAELEVVRPDCELRFESRGDLLGKWDSDRLTQVVSNLVANALQHGGEHGSVSVVAEGHDEDVELRVHNNGPLIPESALKKIFDPMVQQLAQDGDKNKTGMGLGLYIVREVVLAHGGTIGVTSTEKEGTTFTVHIPRQPQKIHTEAA